MTLRSCITGMATVALVALCVGVSPVAAQPHAEGGAAPGALAPTGGQVVETMNSGGYTYVQVDDGAKKFWAAGPQCTVSVGDRVILPDGMVMRDFASKTLGRTFDVIYFTGRRGQSAGPPSRGSDSKCGPRNRPPPGCPP